MSQFANVELRDLRNFFRFWGQTGPNGATMVWISRIASFFGVPTCTVLFHALRLVSVLNSLAQFHPTCLSRMRGPQLRRHTV